MSTDQFQQEGQVFWDRIIDECGGKETALRMLAGLLQKNPEMLGEIFLQNPTGLVAAQQILNSRTLEGWVYVGHIHATPTPTLQWIRRCKTYDIGPSRAPIQIHQLNGILLGTVYTAKMRSWTPESEPPASYWFIDGCGELRNEAYHFEKDSQAKAAIDLALKKNNHGWVVGLYA